jgi:Bacterial extracellular solute-binding proteins, family 3
LAAIQSQPTVIPAFDSVADLFGQKVLTSDFYGSKIGYNATIINPDISNNDGVIAAIKNVDEGRADAFLWDALVVLAGVKNLDESNADVCVYPLKKRIYPFEIGFGVGKDVPQEILGALQASLTALDSSGELRNLRTKYLDGLTKYIGQPVCPRAVEGLTAGQTAGVYVIPAVVFAGILLFAFTTLACRKYKERRSRGNGSSNANNAHPQFKTGNMRDEKPFGSPEAPSIAEMYPPIHAV